jgi:hypothetical protein
MPPQNIWPVFVRIAEWVTPKEAFFMFFKGILQGKLFELISFFLKSR